jgi:hypothetical protein
LTHLAITQDDIPVILILSAEISIYLKQELGT